MHAYAMDMRGRTAQGLMACLGEESRFRLVKALTGGARCVTDLAAEVGLSQSCTTRHLQALERRHIVRGTRDGKRVLYGLREDQPALLPLLAWALRVEWAGVRSAGKDALTPRRPRRPRALTATPPASVAAPPPPAEPIPATNEAPAPELASPTRPGLRGSEIEDFLL